MVSGPLLFLGIGLESSHEFRGSPHKGQSLYGTVGSPFYIAPEVVAGGYNQVADVWNAGVILYILLSGMPLFWGKTKSQIFDAVRVVDLCFPPDQWDCVFASAKALISGMLCMDPAKRLTAVQVLDHAWIKDYLKQVEEGFGQGNLSYRQLDLIGSCFSTSFISGNRDLSFGTGSPVPGNVQQEHSPTFTWKSSLSSFLVDATPFSASGGFSFRSSYESNDPDFSSVALIIRYQSPRSVNIWRFCR
ncbi:calcium-dependent protein kinase 26-like isoform X5 [Tasmannia lanceolata]|uniref:calcium-dependent protein kinase 26-like isoform X5 n=1 Tax=Tasmannia lanceolata TaxID=3420 RepID=UPI004062D33A